MQSGTQGRDSGERERGSRRGCGKMSITTCWMRLQTYQRYEWPHSKLDENVGVRAPKWQTWCDDTEDATERERMRSQTSLHHETTRWYSTISFMVRAEQALLGKEKSTNSEFATSSSDPWIIWWAEQCRQWSTGEVNATCLLSAFCWLRNNSHPWNWVKRLSRNASNRFKSKTRPLKRVMQRSKNKDAIKHQRKLTCRILIFH